MRKFTPIAMRCTKEQFKAIRPKLNNVHCIASFESHNYLVNNYKGKERDITNLLESRKSEFNRTVYETWNEKIFLEACGIEIETFEITKETILKYKMKDEFPEMFVKQMTQEEIEKELGYKIEIV